MLLQETVDWLARPENYDPDLAPPGLEGFDPVPFLLSALPISTSVMVTQFAHELGHRVVAFRKKVCCLSHPHPCQLCHPAFDCALTFFKTMLLLSYIGSWRLCRFNVCCHLHSV